MSYVRSLNMATPLAIVRIMADVLIGPLERYR